MSPFEPIGRVLIIGGAIIAILGLVMVYWQKIPFLGRFPGDFVVQKGNFQFFFPLVTCLILSVILTIIINLIIRLLSR